MAKQAVLLCHNCQSPVASITNRHMNNCINNHWMSKRGTKQKTRSEYWSVNLKNKIKQNKTNQNKIRSWNKIVTVNVCLYKRLGLRIFINIFIFFYWSSIVFWTWLLCIHNTVLSYKNIILDYVEWINMKLIIQ